MLALLRGNDEGWTSAQILAELGGAVAFLSAFIAIEARVKQPMLPLGLFRIRAFTGAQIGAFAISASFFAVFIYTTLYLQQILGLSAIQAGLVYLPGTMIMLFVSAGTANLVPKLGAGRMVAGGLLLVGIGQALLTVAAVDSSWTVFLPGEIIALIGTGIFNPAVSQLALGSAPPEMSGLAAGVNDTFRQAGIAVGVAALGALVPAAHAFGGDRPDLRRRHEGRAVGRRRPLRRRRDRVRRAPGRAPQARDDRRARARRRLARGYGPTAPPALRGWAARSSGTMPGT